MAGVIYLFSQSAVYHVELLFLRDLEKNNLHILQTVNIPLFDFISKYSYKTGKLAVLLRKKIIGFKRDTHGHNFNYCYRRNH